MENQQKTALITGGTSGIGKELAKLFANDKYNLIIVARNQAELDITANELRAYGIQVTTIAKDFPIWNRPKLYAMKLLNK
ncbi:MULTISPECIES: SDR family NAD(P)-dependent oxidoreductase [Mucilaginibacter]|uniref:SDR family NAD(P)-dependent oxidoreductase n=1 Tax=Mucilaginibacter TaxID=423349 RepID=UPI001FB5C20C|nr:MULTISPECIES: SDR family NAD(P)-dependent oxidoreductase [Mucilaginibacter]